MFDILAVEMALSRGFGKAAGEAHEGGLWSGGKKGDRLSRVVWRLAKPPRLIHERLVLKRACIVLPINIVQGCPTDY